MSPLVILNVPPQPEKPVHMKYYTTCTPLCMSRRCYILIVLMFHKKIVKFFYILFFLYVLDCLFLFLQFLVLYIVFVVVVVVFRFDEVKDVTPR